VGCVCDIPQYGQSVAAYIADLLSCIAASTTLPLYFSAAWITRWDAAAAFGLRKELDGFAWRVCGLFCGACGLATLCRKALTFWGFFSAGSSTYLPTTLYTHLVPRWLALCLSSCLPPATVFIARALHAWRRLLVFVVSAAGLAVLGGRCRGYCGVRCPFGRGRGSLRGFGLAWRRPLTIPRAGTFCSGWDAAVARADAERLAGIPAVRCQRS